MLHRYDEADSCLFNSELWATASIKQTNEAQLIGIGG